MCDVIISINASRQSTRLREQDQRRNFTLRDVPIADPSRNQPPPTKTVPSDSDLVLALLFDTGLMPVSVPHSYQGLHTSLRVVRKVPEVIHELRTIDLDVLHPNLFVSSAGTTTPHRLRMSWTSPPVLVSFFFLFHTFISSLPIPMAASYRLRASATASFFLPELTKTVRTANGLPVPRAASYKIRASAAASFPLPALTKTVRTVISVWLRSSLVTTTIPAASSSHRAYIVHICTLTCAFRNEDQYRAHTSTTALYELHASSLASFVNTNIPNIVGGSYELPALAITFSLHVS
ncbi:hypothetical protein B0H13DRAFT_2381989 [Mycena leptocephala]|nr:hypothetical protein B0H13DRAFT_2381989 [Mycena leptocephala]